MGTVTQVHFKLQNGRDMFLKIGLGEIEWLGEKAIQVSISNVTPYLAMIQELQKEQGDAEAGVRRARGPTARGGPTDRRADGG